MIVLLLSILPTLAYLFTALLVTRSVYVSQQTTLARGQEVYEIKTHGSFCHSQRMWGAEQGRCDCGRGRIIKIVHAPCFSGLAWPVILPAKVLTKIVHPELDLAIPDYNVIQKLEAAEAELKELDRLAAEVQAPGRVAKFIKDFRNAR